MNKFYLNLAAFVIAIAYSTFAHSTIADAQTAKISLKDGESFPLRYCGGKDSSVSLEKSGTSFRIVIRNAQCANFELWNQGRAAKTYKLGGKGNKRSGSFTVPKALLGTGLVLGKIRSNSGKSFDMLELNLTSIIPMPKNARVALPNCKGSLLVRRGRQGVELVAQGIAHCDSLAIEAGSFYKRYRLPGKNGARKGTIALPQNEATRLGFDFVVDVYGPGHADKLTGGLPGMRVSPQPVAAPPVAARPASKPIRCDNGERRIDGQNIHIRGDGIVVDGVCTLVISNSTIDATGWGIVVRGAGELIVRNSTISGKSGAIFLDGTGSLSARDSRFGGTVSMDGTGDLEARGSSFTGRLRNKGIGDYVDQGGNRWATPRRR
ncbi:MAG: right-handed parallel beta-helix repeat-containing protein [Kofleriaceae bacterium]|nr:right-handed parallel beta-helix repeat-containing protein [Kofleriaceae bacterium]